MRHRAAAILAFTIAGCAGMRPPAAPITTAARSDTGPASAAKLLFEDEFNAASIDRSVWYTCFFWQKHPRQCSRPALAQFDEANVREGAGNAEIVALTHASTPAHPYTSGMMQTGGRPSSPATFSFLYGYAEARMRLPRGAGMWPAFWLIPKSGAWPPEIDILEWQGVDPNVDVMTIHYTGPNGKPAQDVSAVNTGAKLWQGYHTYAVDWKPRSVTWYFDGKPLKRYVQERFIPNKPMYPVFTLNIGGWEPGSNHPSASEFPATLSIDYVRIWDKKPASSS
jgi:beta-glucanase (GH16 family)